MRVAAVVFAGACMACTGVPTADPTGGQPAGALPAGAVQVGPDLYQVPIGIEDGCAMFRLHSSDPDQMVAQVISYRAIGGGFTTDRSEALCEG